MNEELKDRGLKKAVREQTTFRLPSNFTYRTMQKVEEAIRLREKKSERRILLATIAAAIFFPSEKTGEYYLTDTVQIIKRTDKTVSAFKAASSDSVLGANDCSQLAQLNEIARNRIIEKHLANGVNIPCRDGVMIGCDVKIEAGATILPASIIVGNTVIKAESVIGPAAYIK